MYRTSMTAAAALLAATPLWADSHAATTTEADTTPETVTADDVVIVDDAAGDDAEVAGNDTQLPEAETATPGAEPMGVGAGTNAAMAPAGIMISATALLDAPVYSLSENYDQTFWDSGKPFGPVAGTWTEIGEVEDILFDDSARVLGVTVDYGGFLGIGDDYVLLPVADIRLVQNPENESFFIVTRLSQEQLEEADEIEGVIGGDD